MMKSELKENIYILSSSKLGEELVFPTDEKLSGLLNRLANCSLDFQNELCLVLGKKSKILSSEDSKFDLPPLMKKFVIVGDDESFVFFPGTFDPWHSGHTECVTQLIKKGKKVIIAPDFNPWKDYKLRSPSEVFLEIEKALKENDSVVYYPGFLPLKKINPTITWIEKLEKENRSLLMGDDSFMSLLKWKDAKRLIGLLKSLYVLPRLELKTHRDEQVQKILSLNPELEIHILSHHDYEEVSSTEIRNKTRNKK
ncbi:MAG: nicotinate-nicotinamide nucleotide adenylyltransferase [Bacteriovoracaceae bacterium]